MMRLSKKEESKLMQAYERWWHSYLNGDIETYDSFLAEDYHFVGSTDGEEYLNRRDTTKFLRATADQLAGKAELRNLKRAVETLDGGLVLITDLADAYVLSDGEWVYYSRFRFSSLIRNGKNGWQFVYQHFSAPDTKAGEGQTLGLEKISKENQELRDAIKRRTIELEQKNTELQIEAALERVRAKTMAMHSSRQLSETARELYREFVLLGNIPDRMGVVIFREDTNELELWLTDQEGSKLDQRYTASLDSSPVIRKMLEAWKSGAETIVVDLHGKEVEEWLSFVRNELKLFVDGSHVKGRRVQQAAFFSHGMLLLTSKEPVTQWILKLLIRFAQVFSQTYTRFLDLQKAEAQAREAQIEVALERVRSRSMAMQTSEDFSDVIQVIYDQFIHLNIHIEHTGFIVDYKMNEDMHIWLADLHKIPSQITLPYFDCAHWNSFKEAKEKNLDFFANKLDFEEKNAFYKKLFELVPGLPEEATRSYFEAPGLAISTVLLDNVGLYIENFDGIPYTEEENSILMRFGRVFQQTYTRFRDLQKAEAQARKAQIEAALDRVRTASMAMHTSKELAQVITILGEQLHQLGIEMDAAILNEKVEGSKDWHMWLAIPSGSKELYTRVEQVHVPYKRMAAFDRIYKAAGQGLSIFSDYHNKAQKDLFFRHYFKNSNHRDVPKARQDYIFSCPGLSRTTILSKNSFIQYFRYSQEVFSAEEKKVLERFGHVFEQSYTRFLDLQKAEAQAWEARIEAALERVRAKTMAMHNSEDVGETVVTLFDEVIKLGLDVSIRCGIGIFQGTTRSEIWSANTGSNEEVALVMGILNMTIHPLLAGAAKAWENGKTSYTYELVGKEVSRYYKLLTKEPEYPFQIDLNTLPDNSTFNCFFFKEGSLFAFTPNPLSGEAENILNRFAGVFGQTYRRYLDLKTAEGQAREAQIEVALERVRAKTMAMHKSEQLAETALVLYEQFKLLGNIPDRMSIGIFREDSHEVDLWPTDQTGKLLSRRFTGPLKGTPGMAKTFKAWQEGKEAIVVDLSGQQLEEWLKFIRGKMGLYIDDSHMHGRRVQQAAFFSHGMLLLTTNDPISGEILQLLVRFAKVFSQTYTRFLDLQQAETQAREAYIEAALERVRSKTMAMHNSDDVGETVVALFDEVIKLGLDNSIRCGIGIIQGMNRMETWSANIGPKGKVEMVMGMLDMTIHPLLKGVEKAWQNKKSGYFHELLGKEVHRYYNALNNEPDYPFNSDLNALPEKVIHNSFFFPEGILFSFTHHPLSDEAMKVLARFAGVFGQTYRRYLDLKKAEKQAREAIKQASVDRVRGEISSMRSTEDLQRITPLVWRELTTLGVPFFRCGVFIVDEAEKRVQVYLSAPDGHSLGAMQFEYDANPLTSNVVKFWKKESFYRGHWSRQEFIDWTNLLKTQGQIQDVRTYQDSEVPPESLYLHFIPFKQGMLYVGNTHPLDEEAIAQVQSLTGAFEIAYARYEDFIRLEKAKAGIESALTELKATQSQLIQSEKMASLGELTAGIAHEIQNPLNFVNNFSELNAELLDELGQEIEDGNMEEVKALASDIKQNEEKISHHGKRAESIVKGMLQHSRSSSGVKELVDINVLCDEYLRLSYHGLRAKDKSFNADFKKDFEEAIPKVKVVPQDIGRVLLNLINNAFYTVDKKAKKGAGNFKPEVLIATRKQGSTIEIMVKDNGDGIPKGVREKIFQPFFTTKPTGQGTGLGLSLSYDIVKSHGGQLQMETKNGDGSVFTIKLPIG